MYNLKKGLIVLFVLFLLFTNLSCGIPNWFNFKDDEDDPITITANQITVRNVELSTDDAVHRMNECDISIGFLYAFYDNQLSISERSLVSSLRSRIDWGTQYNANYIPRPGSVLGTYTRTENDVSHEYRILSLRNAQDRTINAPPDYAFSTISTAGFDISGIPNGQSRVYYFNYQINEANSSVQITLQDQDRNVIDSIEFVRATNDNFASNSSNFSATKTDVSSSLVYSNSDNFHVIITPFVYVTLDGYSNRIIFYPSSSSTDNTLFNTIEITRFSTS